jgi:hypothetical protein
MPYISAVVQLMGIAVLISNFKDGSGRKKINQITVG